MALSVRPATLDDAPAIRDLLNAIDVLEIGGPETDLPAVEADLGRPGVDLEADSWLAHENSELVAYGLLWDDSGGERIAMDHYVLPGRPVAAVRLFELMEARAVRRAGANGAARAIVHMHLNSAPTLDTALIDGRGWQRVRRYQVMVREVSGESCPVPVPPPGVTLRDCAAEADRRRAHELWERTFAEHFDHRPRTYEQWLDDLDAGRLDWSLVLIAAVEGLGPVRSIFVDQPAASGAVHRKAEDRPRTGRTWTTPTTRRGAVPGVVGPRRSTGQGLGDAAVLVARDDRESMGWIRNVGVVKEARGRGLGGYLLRHAFSAFAGRGRDTVGLGVDTRNATGALKLYEANGMRPHFAVDTWEVTLPV
ncbi:GNAT family N-acetyltransferase [Streptomyces sp. NPDC058280]|uniref:GNAT family N-acetyltransferase n=1 Tax=Streptomyces sp. NPDC058280 TaxID=3346419 RepID=UPI0036E14416